MKQIGNLAVICAQRNDVFMQIHGARVWVNIGEGPERKCVCFDWNDDEAILDLIRNLNFGKYAPDKKVPSLQQKHFDAMTTLPDCNTCIKWFCEYKPKPGQAVQANSSLCCGGKGKKTE